MRKHIFIVCYLNLILGRSFFATILKNDFIDIHRMITNLLILINGTMIRKGLRSKVLRCQRKTF